MEPENASQIEDAVDAPRPAATFVSQVDREKWVPLQYPVTFDGKVWDRIRIRRISAKELRDYLGAVGDGFVMPPVIDCPIEVWDGMDADDQTDVDEAAFEFMPKRLRAAAEALMASGSHPASTVEQEG